MLSIMSKSQALEYMYSAYIGKSDVENLDHYHFVCLPFSSYGPKYFGGKSKDSSSTVQGRWS